MCEVKIRVQVQEMVLDRQERGQRNLNPGPCAGCEMLRRSNAFARGEGELSTHIDSCHRGGNYCQYDASVYAMR